MIISVILLLFSCSPESNITPTMDRTNQDIRVRVVLHPDAASLEEAYRVANNLTERTAVPEQWGFAAWNQWQDSDGNLIDLPDQDYWCTIHAYEPRHQTDQKVLTLGHELLHCVYGSYHQ